MCGISGVFGKEARNRADYERAVSVMNAAQALRGPDDAGIWSDAKKPVVFGHRRLSIIDLTADGHQPMEYRNLRITFNGEIYNYAELKAELGKLGHVFTTKSDTEVILAAYKEWGTDSFLKLRGMFAFALYDDAKDELLLVRDRFGVKPLYYYDSSEWLVFASTVGALKGSGLVPADEDEQWKTAFMLFGYLPHPLTTLKYVRPLDAGSYLVKNAKGETRIEKYFDLVSLFEHKKDITKEKAVRATRVALEEAVRYHLVADAPLGVFLSGGLDSSVLAVLATRARKDPASTLSIDFKEAAFSEKKYREGLVKNIQSAHKEVLISAEDFYTVFPDILSAMDQPSVDAVNTYFVARAARETGLVAVLSGLGSDEQFFGYKHFRTARMFHMFQALPQILKWPLLIVSRLAGKLSRLEYLYHRGALPRYLTARGLFSPREVVHMTNVPMEEVGGIINAIAVANGLNNPRVARLASEDQISLMEFMFYLKGQLLKDSDFMSMHSSVEVRVPFLDNGLVALLASLPPKLKFGPANKELLVRATEDVIPREVWDRPKMGFTFPFAVWLKKAPHALVTDKTRDLFEKFSSGALHWSRFWARIILLSHEG